MSAKRENDEVSRGVGSVRSPLMLLIAAGWFVYWAFDYGETARQLPVLIGAGTSLLIVLDVLSRLPGRLGTLTRSALGAGFQDRELKHVPSWRAELMQLAWITVCVIGIIAIGILPAVTLYVLFYMLVQGRQGWLSSVIIAAVVLGMVALVFEVALDYELYRGILFDPDGFG